jgi:hypothetical protein
VKTLAISMDASQLNGMLEGAPHVLLNRALSKGIRNSLAVVQNVHKTQVIGRGIGPRMQSVWEHRTGEASRSFHIAMAAGALEGAYGSELKRVGVLEMGTQEALGGPLRPKNGRYLAIPTEKARVGRGRALAPKDRTDLVFIQSLSGQPLLVRPKKGKRGGFDVMFILRTQVTIPPHPTMDKTQVLAQPQVDRIILQSLDDTLKPKGM